MKNLLTLLLLVMSLLASGQSNSQSLEVEIKYWKSIAESNDTVAYREYLQRYGEHGLYKDEALTRITLLKNSGKQTQTKSIECHFYDNGYIVVRFDSNQNKVWIKGDNRGHIESNLAMSRDYYENQAAVAMSRDLYETMTKSSITGKITFDSVLISNHQDVLNFSITATHTPSGKQYEQRFVYTSIDRLDRQVNYYLSLPPGGPYNIEYHMSTEYYWLAVPTKTKTKKVKGITATWDETKIINIAVLNKRPFLVVDEAKTIPRHKDAWTTDEEYQYNPMKSTSARDVYFKQDTLYKVTQYRKKLKSGEYLEDPYSFYTYNCNDYRRDYEYDGVSTSYRIITMPGYEYAAFSKDKSSIIKWFEKDDNLDGDILEKRDYKRIDKEDLLPKPKAVNYDFLNE